MKTLILTLLFSFNFLCFASKENYPLDSRKNTPLFVAIAQGDFQKAESLLKEGAKPNKRSVKRASAFHALSLNNDEQGSIDFFPTLIQYGANINAQDSDGDTGLMVAVLAGKYRLAQEFLKNNNILISKRNKDGDTLLQLFIFYADLTNPDAIQAMDMVFSNEDSIHIINTKTNDGRTLLHLALTPQYENIELLEFLLLQPAIDVNIPDANGAVPILITLRWIAYELYEIIFSEENLELNLQAIYKASQAIKILLTNPNTQLKIKNNQGESPDGMLLFIKEILPQLSEDSPVYPAFKPLREALWMQHKKEYYPLDSPENTALFVAIAQGDFQKAETLLKEGAKPNKRSVKRASVFHALSLNNDEQGSLEFLPTLLKYGANINIKDIDGDTGLSVAIIARKYLLAQEMLKIKNIRLDKQNKKGSTLLHLFVFYIDLTDPDAAQTLNMLLSKEDKASFINAQTHNGQTAMHNAVYYKKVEFLKILDSHPKTNFNIQDDKGNTPISISLLGALDLVDQILSPNEDESDNNDNQLSFLNIYKTHQILKILLNSSHDVDLETKNTTGQSPHELLTYLIRKLSHIPLDSPFYSSFEPMMNSLIGHLEARNSSLFPHDSTELFKAIALGDFQKAETLLKNGADPNKKSFEGATVFHALALAYDEYESAKFLQTLVDYGADINAQDDDGDTGLIVALWNNKHFLAQTFLQQDQFDIYSKNNKGENILFFFSQINLDSLHATQTLNIILSQGGAELINTQNHQGQTPLILSVIHENIELLENLVSDSETDINLKNTISENVPIFIPLLSITEGLYYALHPEEGKQPDSNQIHKASRAIQILLDSPEHNIDLSIKNKQNESPYDIIITLKENLSKLSQNSPFYSTFEPLRQTLALIDTQ